MKYSIEGDKLTIRVRPNEQAGLQALANEYPPDVFDSPTSLQIVLAPMLDEHCFFLVEPELCNDKPGSVVLALLGDEEDGPRVEGNPPGSGLFKIGRNGNLYDQYMPVTHRWAYDASQKSLQRALADEGSVALTGGKFLDRPGGEIKDADYDFGEAPFRHLRLAPDPE